MGTPDFKGVVALFCGLPILLFLSILVLYSIVKILDKRDKKKEINFFGTGRIKIWKILAYSVFCLLASVGYSVLVTDLPGSARLIQIFLLTLLLLVTVSPLYVSIFLIYFFYFYHPSVQEKHKRQTWWFAISTDAIVILLFLSAVSFIFGFPSAYQCICFSILISTVKFKLGRGKKAQAKR